MITAVVAAADEAAPDALAQVAAFRGRQEGLHAGARVEDGPAAVVAQAARGLGGRLADGLGQAGEVGLVRQQGVAVGLLGQHVLREVGVQRGQAHVDGGHFFLLFRAEAGAGQHEVGVGRPHQALLLGRQRSLFGGLVDRLDAAEQRRVLHDLVLVGGELGRHLALERLELGRAQAGAQRVIEGADAIKGAARALQRFEGVFEGRRRRVVGDGVDLDQPRGHGGLEGGPKPCDAGLVEGRQAAEGAAPGGEQGGVCGRVRHGVALWQLGCARRAQGNAANTRRKSAPHDAGTPSVQPGRKARYRNGRLTSMR